VQLARALRGTAESGKDVVAGAVAKLVPRDLRLPLLLLVLRRLVPMVLLWRERPLLLLVLRLLLLLLLVMRLLPLLLLLLLLLLLRLHGHAGHSDRVCNVRHQRKSQRCDVVWTLRGAALPAKAATNKET